MAYTDDAVKAKLSALNETQDAIVAVAQWIMFHKYGNSAQIHHIRIIAIWSCQTRGTNKLVVQEIRGPYRADLGAAANRVESSQTTELDLSSKW